MSDALYNQRIKELAARLESRIASPDVSATLDNPLCGDRVTIELKMENGAPVEIGRAVKGCLLCRASAALLAEQGEMAPDVESIRRMLHGEEVVTPPGWEIFAPVSEHKSRHDCVLLPLKAFTKANESN
jgi:NifU-like protein involved in Fe-S cluster formation